MARRSVKKMKTNTSKEIKQLKKDVNTLKRSNETKYHDELYTKGAVERDVNNVTTLLDPGQGSTNQTRVGNEISPYRIHLKGDVRIANAGSVGKGSVRVMVIQSKQGYVPSTISTSTVDKLFIYPNAEVTPHSPLDLNNRQHYVVLFDKTYMLDAAGKQIAKVNINKKISRNVTFVEAGSTTAEKGQIYLCLTSSSATLNDFEFQGYSRIFYKD